MQIWKKEFSHMVFPRDHPRCPECLLLEEREKHTKSKTAYDALKLEHAVHWKHAQELQQESIKACCRSKNSTSNEPPLSLVIDNKVFSLYPSSSIPNKSLLEKRGDSTWKAHCRIWQLATTYVWRSACSD
jgi:hypothetical protein